MIYPTEWKYTGFEKEVSRMLSATEQESCDASLLPKNLNILPADVPMASEIAAEKAAQIRARRDKLLSDCDWTQMSDCSLCGNPAWLAYRQALRDMTKQVGFPENVIEPVSP